MLIKCPECELQISDKALSCPHCGYPMKPEALEKTNKKSNKRRRLPNGFGQISKLHNPNLRKPFRAMITVGKTSTGRPICKLLKPEAFFETYNDAYAALIEYNRNPYDLDPGISTKELYEKWTAEHFKTIAIPSAKGIESAWLYCSSVYELPARDLRARHVKFCMDESTAIIRGKERKPTAAKKNQIKSLFNLMLDYALEFEIVDKNYSRTFKLSDETINEIFDTKNPHIPYTDEEMKLLWENSELKYVDALLVQCYAGWRPSELCNLEIENTDVENWIFTGGMKTASGKNRVVPIHSKIRPIVLKKYEEAKRLGSKYLFNDVNPDKQKRNTQLTYIKYSKGLDDVVRVLNLNPEHKPHDGRKHFVTAAKNNGVDEYAIKYIVGHKIDDLTEKVYTERKDTWLKEEIEKIK